MSERDQPQIGVIRRRTLILLSSLVSNQSYTSYPFSAVQRFGEIGRIRIIPNQDALPSHWSTKQNALA
jgi:hypothetical protein